MGNRDLTVLQQIEDQILGISGPDLLLPESAEIAVLRAIKTAISTRNPDASRIAFSLVWDDPGVRRQPWETGIRSYIGDRLYGSLERTATVSLASDIASNPQIAHAVGRDESGIWIPELVFRLVADDLELHDQDADISTPDAPSAHVITTLMEWLRTITAGEPSAVAIYSPSYWSLVPGWYLTDRGSPEMSLLSDAYRRRTVTTSTMLSHDAAIPLGDITSFVPGRSQWEGFSSLTLAANAFDRTVDIEAAAQIVHAIPPYHRQILVAGTREQTLPAALHGFLASIIGRHLLCGVYVPKGGTRYSYLQRPGRPYEPAAVTALTDGRIAVTASVIPSSLTRLGLLPEAPGMGIGGLPYISYPWSTLCGAMGLGGLLRKAWPDRTTFASDSDLPYSDDWLILPAHLSDILADALQRADDLHREPEHFL